MSTTTADRSLGLTTPTAARDAMLEVSELRKLFRPAHGEPVQAIDGVSFEVAVGKVFTLVGPSGCGKSTTLRSIAGLETPDSGRITIAGDAIVDSSQNVLVPANRRPLGMVFQSYAIWPHMSVFENVAFPLVASKGSRPSKSELRDKVGGALATVDMAGYEERPATALSGGQQQRLALARALVADPSLLLLDEPLSNLDAKLRHQMRFELQNLQSEVGVTTVYVTHDQAEALALSDEIAVMRAGAIVQQGTPQQIFDEPNSEFVADFIGSTNLIEGQLDGAIRAGEVATVHVGSVDVEGVAVSDILTTDDVVLAVRPELFALDEPSSPDDRRLGAGRVLSNAYGGATTDYLIDFEGRHVNVRVPSGPAYAFGERVDLFAPLARCLVMVRDRVPDADDEEQAGWRP